jgi:hypothetical protein
MKLIAQLSFHLAVYKTALDEYVVTRNRAPLHSFDDLDQAVRTAQSLIHQRSRHHVAA